MNHSSPSFKVRTMTVRPRAETYAPGDEVELVVTTRVNGRAAEAVVGLVVTDESVLEMVETREQAPRLPAMALLLSTVAGRLRSCLPGHGGR